MHLIGYYEHDDARRADKVRVARTAFESLLRADMVQSNGQVLLGTPLGADSADVHVGSAQYRSGKLRDMLDQHDDRLRSVVALSRRSGTARTSTLSTERT